GMRRQRSEVRGHTQGASGMPVSGVRITFVPDPERRERALARMGEISQIHVVTGRDSHAAATISAPTERGRRDLHDWLASLDGVAAVDVVFAETSTDRRSFLGAA